LIPSLPTDITSERKFLIEAMVGNEGTNIF
jgi:hypothetical protein